MGGYSDDDEIPAVLSHQKGRWGADKNNWQFNRLDEAAGERKQARAPRPRACPNATRAPSERAQAVARAHRVPTGQRRGGCGARRPRVPTGDRAAAAAARRPARARRPGAGGAVCSGRAAAKEVEPRSGGARRRRRPGDGARPSPRASRPRTARCPRSRTPSADLGEHRGGGGRGRGRRARGRGEEETAAAAAAAERGRRGHTPDQPLAAPPPRARPRERRRPRTRRGRRAPIPTAATQPRQRASAARRRGRREPRHGRRERRARGGRRRGRRRGAGGVRRRLARGSGRCRTAAGAAAAPAALAPGGGVRAVVLPARAREQPAVDARAVEAVPRRYAQRVACAKSRRQMTLARRVAGRPPRRARAGANAGAKLPPHSCETDEPRARRRARSAARPAPPPPRAAACAAALGARDVDLREQRGRAARRARARHRRRERGRRGGRRRRRGAAGRRAAPPRRARWPRALLGPIGAASSPARRADELLRPSRAPPAAPRRWRKCPTCVPPLLARHEERALGRRRRAARAIRPSFVTDGGTECCSAPTRIVAQTLDEPCCSASPASTVPTARAPRPACRAATSARPGRYRRVKFFRCRERRRSCASLFDACASELCRHSPAILASEAHFVAAKSTIFLRNFFGLRAGSCPAATASTMYIGSLAPRLGADVGARGVARRRSGCSGDDPSLPRSSMLSHILTALV